MEEETQKRKSKATGIEGAAPSHVVRHGAIAASIWRRQSPSGYAYFDFSLSRSYKSMSTGKEGYSTNFFERNQDDLQRAILGATAWIVEQSKGEVRPESN